MGAGRASAEAPVVEQLAAGFELQAAAAHIPKQAGQGAAADSPVFLQVVVAEELVFEEYIAEQALPLLSCNGAGRVAGSQGAAFPAVTHLPGQGLGLTQTWSQGDDVLRQ